MTNIYVCMYRWESEIQCQVLVWPILKRNIPALFKYLKKKKFYVVEARWCTIVCDLMVYS